MTNLTATIAKREDFSANLGIIACIAMIFVSLSACAMDEGINDFHAQGFDMEGDTVYLSNDAPLLVENKLYIAEEAKEMDLKSISFHITNGRMIDWRSTTIFLDGMLLSPEVKRRRVEGLDSTTLVITVIWEDISWDAERDYHSIGFDIFLHEDAPSGTEFEFWTSSLSFENQETEEIYRGYRDIDLGEKGLSGAMQTRVRYGEEEEAFQTKVSKLVIVD